MAPLLSNLTISSSFIADLEEKDLQVIDQISDFIKETKTIQLTSFGATGMVIIDMLSKVNLLNRIPLVFIDTLHHFPETYELVEEVKRKYPEIDLRIYKPRGCETREDFEKKFGAELWKTMPTKYGYYTKAEPRDRAMAELGVKAYINGRRRTQGEKRGDLNFFEEDEELNIIRVQPLCDWTYADVWAYVRKHSVPTNVLHTKGYKSIGDFMTTVPVGEWEDERAGRWKGTNQTECGLHISPSSLASLV